jgi:hypothetical protein
MKRVIPLRKFNFSQIKGFSKVGILKPGFGFLQLGQY